jgi:ribose transport system permease protein
LVVPNKNLVQRYFTQLGVDIPADTFPQVVFGVVIIGMLLIYGRQQLAR